MRTIAYINEEIDKAYEELSVAVVYQAFEDLKFAYRKLKKEKDEKERIRYFARIDECVKFFNSDLIYLYISESTSDLLNEEIDRILMWGWDCESVKRKYCIYHRTDSVRD